MSFNKALRYLLPLIALLLAAIWLVAEPPSQPAAGPDPLGPAAADRIPAGTAQSGPAAAARTIRYDPVQPHIVDFSRLPPETMVPEEGAQQAIQQEVTIVAEAELHSLRAAALQRGPTSDLQLATEALAPAEPLVTFESIDYSESGRMVPPDPKLAAGPEHVVVAVNATVAIYDKQGRALLGPRAASNFFSRPPCQSGLYDPNVVYDEEAQRWLLAYDQGARSTSGGYCLLASLSSNPLGEWKEYFFPFNDSSAWLDFPHAGVGDQYLFVGANMFNHQSPSRFVEGRVFALKKADLYDRQAAVAPVALGLSSSYDTPQPLQLHGYNQGEWPAFGNAHYFLADPWDGRHYALFRWDPTMPVGSLSEIRVGTVDLGSGSETQLDLLPVYVPQAGGDPLEANDFRPLDFEYRNGYGWTAMTVACNPGGGTVNCIRWAQIDLRTATLGPAGRGIYGSAGHYRFFPDLAVDKCGNMLIGYSRSSSATFPGSWVAGRRVGDAAGQLRGEQLLQAGERPYTSFENVTIERPARRWGDYTGLAVDPDGLTLWYVGQYSKEMGYSNQTNWGTAVGAFTLAPYPSCTPPVMEPRSYLPLLQHETQPDSVPSPVTLKREDFEGVFPNEWSVYDSNSGDGYFFWDRSACRAAGGTYSGGAVASGAIACGDPYPANVTSWLIYGPVSLADATDAGLQFNFWHHSEVDADSFFWGVSPDRQNLYGYAVSGNWSSWQETILDLKDVPSLGDVRGDGEVWIAFGFSSDGTESVGEGSYVDDIYFWKETNSRNGMTSPAPPRAGENSAIRAEIRPFPKSR